MYEFYKWHDFICSIRNDIKQVACSLALDLRKGLLFKSEQTCLEATIYQPFTNTKASWHGNETLLHCSKSFTWTYNTLFLLGHSYLHFLNPWVALSHSKQGISLSFAPSFSSVSWNHFNVPPKHSLALERTAQSRPSPQHSTPLKRLFTQWVQLPAGRPIDALLWVDCSLLERGGEGWSEWGRPNPTPGHWAWSSRCKHPALLSPWVGS